VKRLTKTRGVAAVIVATIALIVLAAGRSAATNAVGPTKGTFTVSFQAGPNSRTSQLFSIRDDDFNEAEPWRQSRAEYQR